MCTSSFDPRSGEAQPVCSHCSSPPFSLCYFQPPKSHELRFHFTLSCSVKLPKSYLQTASILTQFHYHIIQHSSPQDREKQEAKFPAIKLNLWNEGRREHSVQWTPIRKLVIRRPGELLTYSYWTLRPQGLFRWPKLAQAGISLPKYCLYLLLSLASRKETWHIVTGLCPSPVDHGNI